MKYKEAYMNSFVVHLGLFTDVTVIFNFIEFIFQF